MQDYPAPEFWSKGNNSISHYIIPLLGQEPVGCVATQKQYINANICSKKTVRFCTYRTLEQRRLRRPYAWADPEWRKGGGRVSGSHWKITNL